MQTPSDGACFQEAALASAARRCMQAARQLHHLFRYTVCDFTAPRERLDFMIVSDRPAFNA